MNIRITSFRMIVLLAGLGLVPVSFAQEASGQDLCAKKIEAALRQPVTKKDPELSNERNSAALMAYASRILGDRPVVAFGSAGVINAKSSRVSYRTREGRQEKIHLFYGKGAILRGYKIERFSHRVEYKCIANLQ